MSILTIYCCEPKRAEQQVGCSKFYSEQEFFKDHEKAKTRKSELEAQEYLRHRGITVLRVAISSIYWKDEDRGYAHRDYNCLICGPSYEYNDPPDDIDKGTYMLCIIDPETIWCEICQVGICNVCCNTKLLDEISQVAKDFILYDRGEGPTDDHYWYSFCQKCIDKYDQMEEYPGYGKLVKSDPDEPSFTGSVSFARMTERKTE